MFSQSIIGIALSWAGILAGALTVFSNLSTVIGISDWSRWVTSHWQEWMTVLWGSYLGLANVTTDPNIVVVDVPFLASLVLIAIASRLMNDDPAVVSRRRAFYSLLTGAVVLFAIYAIVSVLWNYGHRASVMGDGILFAGFWLVMFLMVSHWPYYLAVASASAALILFVLLLAARGEQELAAEVPYASLAGEFLLVIVAASLIVFVAKPAPCTRHLWILVLCVMTLAGLNAISDFRFDLAPPTSAMLFSVASS